MQVKKFFFSGRLIITLNKLRKDPPLHSGLSAYFVNPPSVNFEIGALGQLVNFFNIRPMIDQAIHNAMCNSVVLPKRIVAGIASNDKTFSSAADIVRPLPRGILRVRVVAAKNLRRGAIPYCEISVGGTSHRTPPARNRINPTWDDAKSSSTFFGTGTELGYCPVSDAGFSYDREPPRSKTRGGSHLGTPLHQQNDDFDVSHEEGPPKNVKNGRRTA